MVHLMMSLIGHTSLISLSRISSAEKKFGGRASKEITLTTIRPIDSETLAIAKIFTIEFGGIDET
jgi:hypothetical protein